MEHSNEKSNTEIFSFSKRRRQTCEASLYHRNSPGHMLSNLKFFHSTAWATIAACILTIVVFLIFSNTLAGIFYGHPVIVLKILSSVQIFSTFQINIWSISKYDLGTHPLTTIYSLALEFGF